MGENRQFSMAWHLPALCMLDLILMNIRASSPIDFCAEILVNIYKAILNDQKVQILYKILNITYELAKPLGILLCVILILIPQTKLKKLYIQMLCLALVITSYVICDHLIICAFMSNGLVNPQESNKFFNYSYLKSDKYIQFIKKFSPNSTKMVDMKIIGNLSFVSISLALSLMMDFLLAHSMASSIDRTIYNPSPSLIPSLLMPSSCLRKSSSILHLFSRFPLFCFFFLASNPAFLVLLPSLAIIFGVPLPFLYSLASTYHLMRTIFRSANTLCLGLLPPAVDYALAYLSEARALSHLTGPAPFIETEWMRLRVRALLGTYWIFRTITILFWMHGPDPLSFGLIRTWLLRSCCDSFLAVASSAAILHYIVEGVGIALKIAYLSFNIKGPDNKNEYNCKERVKDDADGYIQAVVEEDNDVMGDCGGKLCTEDYLISSIDYKNTCFSNKMIIDNFPNTSIDDKFENKFNLSHDMINVNQIDQKGECRCTQIDSQLPSHNIYPSDLSLQKSSSFSTTFYPSPPSPKHPSIEIIDDRFVNNYHDSFFNQIPDRCKVIPIERDILADDQLSSTNLARTAALVFLVTAAQTGLTSASLPDHVKLDRLIRNAVLVVLACLHHVQDMLATRLATLSLGFPPMAPSHFFERICKYISAPLISLGIAILGFKVNSTPFSFLKWASKPLTLFSSPLLPPFATLFTMLTLLFAIPAWIACHFLRTHHSILRQQNREIPTLDDSSLIFYFPPTSKVLNTWLVSVTVLCLELCVKTILTLILFTINRGALSRPLSTETEEDSDYTARRSSKESSNFKRTTKTTPYFELSNFKMLDHTSFAKVPLISVQDSEPSRGFLTPLDFINSTNLDKQKPYLELNRNPYPVPSSIPTSSDPSDSSDVASNDLSCSTETYIWYATAFGDCLETCCALVLTLNSLWILIFEIDSGGSSCVRAATTLLNFYFNCWLKGERGLSTLVRRWRAPDILDGLISKTGLYDPVELCPVCRGKLGHSSYVKVLTTSCGHAYHVDCLRKWLYKKLDCPVCRTRF
ncbi:unnamed protein product [Gordionus sp. m RMFG-2023]|uniref:uncharacterized protein LOC135927509 isoform X2 n=1 Tax=Gordionus sp. m RMFG-2023 TaxID=3053472 RepID=UPI0030DF5FB8